MPKYDYSLSSKLPAVGTTIFTTMSGLANKENAINLSQGFPDFPIDKKLSGLVSKFMEAGDNQYAPMPGAIQLREALVEKIERIYGAVYSPDTEITITVGATQAIYTAISALVREEDEVIIFSPAYDCYEPAIEINGGKTIFVKLKSPEYQVDWEEVKKLVSRKTKMIIINSPHNPTGSIWSERDLNELDKITKDSDIIVLSDEVYEHIIFDEQVHQSVVRNKRLQDRSLVVASFGKTFHVTGWKMGYIFGPEELMKEFRKVHQFNVFSCNHPMQLAIAEYVADENNYLGLGAFYQKKRDLFNEVVDGSRFNLLKSSGTYFELLDYSNITDEKDTDFAIRMTKEFGLASIPVSVFYHTPNEDKVLRFCFAKQDETILKAAEILTKI
ncbi:MAG: methionine aminotransferase [Parvicellaceae bacterium]|jgi:methionine aminotransferase